MGIAGTSLVLNMLILYPTPKWNKFGPFAALWSLLSGTLFLWRVIVATPGRMSIANNMPFSLPLGIGSNIIKLTFEDGNKGFIQRWKTLFQVILGKNPEYMHSTMSEYTHSTVNISKSLRKYRRADDLLRSLALFVDLLAMTIGLIRAYRWWDLFDVIGDDMCFTTFTKNIDTSYERITCGIIITDWSSATYNICVPFEPAVGWFLIIVYTAVLLVSLVGLIAMRGYFIWSVGIVGSASLIILSGLQSVYSIQSHCVQFVANLLGLTELPIQFLSHQSLINLWWYRNGFRQWLVNLFTIHG
ncbi:hypothetical protein F8M41_005426 [Gigaspora margarita]|uniref:Uncharacterized protein n=1 Tax=Gigaspora margarita TaxID=4874 RepID=A0A8H4AXB4_GIGMA|nr:hypothetical protein F8M41_005426 [Gigaspora margarita]